MSRWATTGREQVRQTSRYSITVGAQQERLSDFQASRHVGLGLHIDRSYFAAPSPTTSNGPQYAG
jgi:hypothetical protein